MSLAVGLVLGLVVVGGLPGGARAWSNSLARVPYMGWSSWNAFACNVDAKLVEETARALERSGLADLGYTHVNIDDCWAERQRSPTTGRIVPNKQKFPLGMANLSATLRAMRAPSSPPLQQQPGGAAAGGSKATPFTLGIYSDAGERTCQDFPGSGGHELLDAETFHEWGIGFLKLDWCGEELDDPRDVYPKMQRALQAVSNKYEAGKAWIVFNMCEWGLWDPWDWAQPLAHSWRTNIDVKDRWIAILRIAETRVLHDLWARSGPGLGWNDADSLEVGVKIDGKEGLTLAESRSHMALWCFWNSPLILGNDVRNMTKETLSIVGNEELIAINQDPLGREARLVKQEGLDGMVWARPLHNGDVAVLLWNRFDTGSDTLSFTWGDVWLAQDQQVDVRDLYGHKSLGTHSGSFSASVAAHDCVALRLRLL